MLCSLATPTGIRRVVSLGPSTLRALSTEESKSIIKHYRELYPEAQVLPYDALVADYADCNFLQQMVYEHSHIILDGRRIIPSESLTNAPDSIVQAYVDGHKYVGQVHVILRHYQPGIPSDSVLVGVRWFRPANPVHATHWTA